MTALKDPLKNPIQSLSLVFILWKTLLFIVAFLSPGPGYDTSTNLLFHDESLNTIDNNWSAVVASHIVSRLVRWDAIYFVQTSHRGYVHEQEYAFGMGFSQSVSLLTSFLPGFNHTLTTHALIATLLAIIAHYLSTLTLHCLTLSIFHSSTTIARTAWLASILYILSPAGLFLSAPYAESLFALLNFAGYWAYSAARIKGNFALLLPIAGLAFGAAATVRSNGLFSGLLFAYDAVALLQHGLRLFTSPALIARASLIIFSGALVAVGFAVPQVIAYRRFCMTPEVEHLRPWCSRLPPSIYTFVQDHYWNVGFLRYWTPGNVPLFMLAAPTLAALVVSSWMALRGTLVVTANPSSTAHGLAHAHAIAMLRRLAFPQLLLAVLAFLVFHVQVIVRLASGYPVLYIWAAVMIERDETIRGLGRTWTVGKFVVGFAVVYAVVQGGLFASFMPPA